MDPSQYGNQHGVSTQHYLINMIHKILSDTDTSEVTAVLATFIDWKDAFPNQCPKLGIEAFQKCGVRNALIPVLVSYLQERSVIVKWHGKQSKEILTPGGGPQGGYLGNMEYLAQSNKSADCVKKDSRFKFVDDLTVLEKIQILVIGLTSYNSKYQVPNDIHMNNHFIPKENLKSQSYLDNIQKWTRNQKMKLNTEKTKCMLFNFTRSKQFSTQLTLQSSQLETVVEMKLLGTIVTNNLKWNKNTSYIIKKAYARMEILRKIKSFTKSTSDKLHIYKTFIRNNVEQSCVVWGSSLSKKNERDIERVQKIAVNLILNKKHTYKEALEILNIPTLKTRRKLLIARFAEKCIANSKTKNMFETTNKKHTMITRKAKKYQETNAKTVRLARSAIPTMQKHLNMKHESMKKLLE